MENKTPNTGNEAPASVTYSITSEDGFNALFTIRGEKGLELLDLMYHIEKKLIEKRYKPQIKQSFGAGAKKEVQYVEGRVCPDCGKRIVKKEKLEQCEDYKYDFTAKKNTGACNYHKFN